MLEPILEAKPIAKPIVEDFPIRGNLEDLKDTIYNQPSICLVVGDKGSGKTGLGLVLHETAKALNPNVESWVIQYKKPFPSWIKQSPYIEHIPNDSEVFCDEAWLTLSSLAGTSTNKKRQLMFGLFATAIQNGLHYKFVVQNSYLLDVNALRLLDVLFIKEPSLFQIDTERTFMKKYLRTAFEFFERIPKNERKEYAYVVGKNYEGVIKNELPSYWSQDIRFAFRRR